MSEEEAIDILENSIADYVIGEYCEKCADNKICNDRNEDCYFQQAIDIVVKAYEKEKEKNRTLEELKEEYNTKLLSNARIYQLGFNDGEKSVKNEIKAKIEELEAMYDKLPKNPKEHLHSKTEYKIVIGELQSLLKEE